MHARTTTTPRARVRLLLMLSLLSGLLLPLVWEIGAAFAASTYHVDDAGSDTTGQGTQASPWRTLNKASSMAGAGDTVLIHGGTYTLADEMAIYETSNTAWISFEAASGEQQAENKNQAKGS